MLQFLEQQKRKPVLLSQNLNYIVLKYDLDIKYNYFTLNKNNMTNDFGYAEWKLYDAK
jgi:hypothetical protein